MTELVSDTRLHEVYESVGELLKLLTKLLSDELLAVTNNWRGNRQTVFSLEECFDIFF